MSSDDDDYGAPPPPGGGGLDGTGKFDAIAKKKVDIDPDSAAPPPMKRTSTVTLEPPHSSSDEDESGHSNPNSIPTSPWGHGMAPAKSFRLFATNSMMIPALSGMYLGLTGGTSTGSLTAGATAGAGDFNWGAEGFEMSITNFNQSTNVTPRFTATNIIRASMSSLKKFLFQNGENVGTHNVKPPEPDKQEIEDTNCVLNEQEMSEGEDNTTTSESASQRQDDEASLQEVNSGSFLNGQNNFHHTNNNNNRRRRSNQSPLNNSTTAAGAEGGSKKHNSRKNKKSENNNIDSSKSANYDSNNDNNNKPLFGILNTGGSSPHGGQHLSEIHPSNSKNSRSDESGGGSPVSGVFPQIPKQNSYFSSQLQQTSQRPLTMGNYSITSVTSTAGEDISFNVGAAASTIAKDPRKTPESSNINNNNNNSGNNENNNSATAVMMTATATRSHNNGNLINTLNSYNHNRSDSAGSHRRSTTPPALQQQQRPNSASAGETSKRTSVRFDNYNNNNSGPVPQGSVNPNANNNNSNINNTVNPSYGDVAWANSTPTSGRTTRNELHQHHSMNLNPSDLVGNNNNSNNNTTSVQVQLPKKLTESVNEKTNDSNNAAPGTARGGSEAKSGKKPGQGEEDDEKNNNNAGDDENDDENDDEDDEEEDENNEAGSPNFNRENSGTDLRRGPKVGEGGFAAVYVGLLIHKDLQRVVAIKEIEFDTEVTSTELKGVASEFEILRSFRHPNVIRYIFFDYSISKQVCRIVMEYVSAGSLQAIVLQGRVLSEPVLRDFAKQLLEGIAYIHSHGVSHRDIKPANVLLHHDGTVKLADFGCSRTLNQLVENAKCVFGSPIYMPPEQIEGDIMAASDVWSLGCTILELATGRQPWYETGLKQNLYLMFHITGKDTIPYFPQTMGSVEFRDFLKACFVRDAAARPSAKELLEHPWIVNSSATTNNNNTKNGNNNNINNNTDSSNNALSGVDLSLTPPPRRQNSAEAAGDGATPTGIEQTLQALGAAGVSNTNSGDHQLSLPQPGREAASSSSTNTTPTHRSNQQSNNGNSSNHHNNNNNNNNNNSSSSQSANNAIAVRQEIEDICARQCSMICGQLIGLSEATIANFPGLLRRESVAPNADRNNNSINGNYFNGSFKAGNNNNNNNNSSNAALFANGSQTSHPLSSSKDINSGKNPSLGQPHHSRGGSPSSGPFAAGGFITPTTDQQTPLPSAIPSGYNNTENNNNNNNSNNNMKAVFGRRESSAVDLGLIVTSGGKNPTAHIRNGSSSNISTPANATSASNPNLLRVGSSNKIQRSPSVMSLQSNPATSGKHQVIRASEANINNKDGTLSPNNIINNNEHLYSTNEEYLSAASNGGGRGGTNTNVPYFGAGSSGNGGFQAFYDNPAGAIGADAAFFVPGLGPSSSSALPHSLGLGVGAPVGLMTRRVSHALSAGAGAFSALPEQNQQQLIIEIEEAVGTDESLAGSFLEGGSEGTNIVNPCNNDSTTNPPSFARQPTATDFKERSNHSGSTSSGSPRRNIDNSGNKQGGRNKALHNLQLTSPTQNFAVDSGEIFGDSIHGDNNNNNNSQQQQQERGEGGGVIMATTATITDFTGAPFGRMGRSKSMALLFGGGGADYQSPDRCLSEEVDLATPRANGEQSNLVSPAGKHGETKNRTIAGGGNGNGDGDGTTGSGNDSSSSKNATPRSAQLVAPERSNSMAFNRRQSFALGAGRPSKPITVAVPIAPNAPPVLLHLAPEDLIEAPSQYQQQQQQQYQGGQYTSFSMANTLHSGGLFSGDSSAMKPNTRQHNNNNSQSHKIVDDDLSNELGGIRKESSQPTIGGLEDSPSESPYSNSSLPVKREQSQMASGGALSGYGSQGTTLLSGIGGVTNYASFRLERAASLAAGGFSIPQALQQQHMMTRKKSYVVTLTDNVLAQLQNAMMERKKNMAANANANNNNNNNLDASTSSHPGGNSSSPIDHNNSHNRGLDSLTNSPTLGLTGGGATSFSRSESQQQLLPHGLTSEPTMTIPTQEIEDQYNNAQSVLLNNYLGSAAHHHYGSMRKANTTSSFYRNKNSTSHHNLLTAGNILNHNNNSSNPMLSVSGNHLLNVNNSGGVGSSFGNSINNNIIPNISSGPNQGTIAGFVQGVANYAGGSGGNAARMFAGDIYGRQTSSPRRPDSFEIVSSDLQSPSSPGQLFQNSNNSNSNNNKGGSRLSPSKPKNPTSPTSQNNNKNNTFPTTTTQPLEGMAGEVNKNNRRSSNDKNTFMKSEQQQQQQHHAHFAATGTSPTNRNRQNSSSGSGQLQNNSGSSNNPLFTITGEERNSSFARQQQNNSNNNHSDSGDNSKHNNNNSGSNNSGSNSNSNENTNNKPKTSGIRESAIYSENNEGDGMKFVPPPLKTKDGVIISTGRGANTNKNKNSEARESNHNKKSGKHHNNDGRNSKTRNNVIAKGGDDDDDDDDDNQGEPEKQQTTGRGENNTNNTNNKHLPPRQSILSSTSSSFATSGSSDETGSNSNDHEIQPNATRQTLVMEAAEDDNHTGSGARKGGKRTQKDNSDASKDSELDDLELSLESTGNNNRKNQTKKLGINPNGSTVITPAGMMASSSFNKHNGASQSTNNTNNTDINENSNLLPKQRIIPPVTSTISPVNQHNNNIINNNNIPSNNNNTVLGNLIVRPGSASSAPNSARINGGNATPMLNAASMVRQESSSSLILSNTAPTGPPLQLLQVAPLSAHNNNNKNNNNVVLPALMQNNSSSSSNNFDDAGVATAGLLVTGSKIVKPLAVKHSKAKANAPTTTTTATSGNNRLQQPLGGVSAIGNNNNNNPASSSITPVSSQTVSSTSQPNSRAGSGSGINSVTNSGSNNNVLPNVVNNNNSNSNRNNSASNNSRNSATTTPEPILPQMGTSNNSFGRKK